MLRRSHLASLGISSISLVLVAAASGCGEDNPDIVTGSVSSSSASGTGGEGGTGGSGGSGGGVGGTGGVGGSGGSGGSMCVPTNEVCNDNIDNNCDGQVDENCCAPGTTQPCYTGDPATKGVGICAEGIATCQPDGTFGACVGDVLPTAETCNGVDDDCNGAVDETGGCQCVPGTTKSCYSGPMNTENTGICKAGTALCAPDGKSFGPCIGEVLPGVETCNMLDDDCDGMVDDGIGCACTVGQTQTCYTGPAGTAGVGLCKSGMALCLPDGTGFGACMGEVLPAVENCAAAPDEDCNMTAELCTGNYVTAKTWGDTLIQEAKDVAVDPSGNVYVIGSFQGSLNVGGAVGTLTSAGGYDVFVAKLDSTGNVIWAKQYGDVADQRGNAIAVDPQGNIAITGSFQGKIGFGMGTFTTNGGDDFFLAKLDTNGMRLWDRAVGNTATQEGIDVAMAANGDVYAAGHYSGDIKFGAIVVATVAGRDAFLVKYNAAGTVQWAKAYAGTQDDKALGIAVTPAGQVTYIGSFQKSVNFGGGLLTSPDNAGQPAYNVVLVRLDTSGVHLWSKTFGDASDQGQLAGAVAVDPSGNVIATGEFSGNIDFGGGALTSTDGTTNVDGFLVKLDAMGTHQWSKKFGGTTAQRGKGITTDLFGNIVVTGEFFGQLDLGSGPIASAGGRDVFVGKLDPTGKAFWARRYGSGNMKHQSGESVATDPKAYIWVTGTFEDLIDFGGGPITSAGATDMFLAKLAP